MPPVVRAVDIHRLFDIDLPKALAANAAKAQQELGAIFLITITGDAKEAGAWMITAVPGIPPSCKRLENEAMCDVSITIPAARLIKLLATPMKAYMAMQYRMTGVMSIEGNLAVAARLEKLLGLIPGF